MIRRAEDNPAYRAVIKELKPLRDAIENSDGRWRLPEEEKAKTMTIPELIDRLQKAEGPSRELDRFIMCELGGWHRITPSQLGRKHGGFISPEDWIGRYTDGRPILDGLHGTEIYREVPSVTASIDAAIAFMRRVLKGVVIRTLLNEDDMACKAQICCMPNGLSQGTQINVEAWHQYEAIALVIATLRALAEHEEAGR